MAAITLVALLVRLPGLDDSVFGDELFTYEIATRPGFADMLDGVTGPLEISPPLYFVFAWVAAKIGDPQLWIRVPALVAGVATVPALYALGLRTLDRPAALAGAACLALSPFATFYSSEARAYTLAALLLVLTVLAMLSALEEGGAWRWGLFALAAWAALFSHYTAVFVLAAAVGWAAWTRRDRLRELALACAVVALGLLPWLPSFLDDRTAGFQTAIENVNPLTASFFVRSLGIAFVGNPYVGLRELPGWPALVLLAAGLLLALAGAVALRERLRVDSRVALVAALALATPVGAALYSIPFTSVYVPRTLTASLPAFCLLLGYLLTRPRPQIAVPATALIVAALAIGTLEAYGENPKPPYREAAQFINERTRPGDPVIQLGLLVDYGSLDVQLEKPFRLYKQFCERAVTDGGQIITAEVRCSGQDPLERVVREAPRRIMVVTYGSPGRIDLPGLAENFRLAQVRRFGHAQFPLEVREYARR